MKQLKPYCKEIARAKRQVSFVKHYRQATLKEPQEAVFPSAPGSELENLRF